MFDNLKIMRKKNISNNRIKKSKVFIRINNIKFRIIKYKILIIR